MARTPNKPQQPTAQSGQQPPLTRRGRARWQRERERQRQTVIIAGAAVGLAIFAIFVGVLYDQVWVPSRPVAQVNTTTLNRGSYRHERRNEIARRISQNLLLMNMLGGQFRDQFAGQTPTLDSQVAEIDNATPDDETLNGWVERELIQQGANELKLQVSDGEIAQALVGELGGTFGLPPLPPTTTSTLTATTTTTDTTPIATSAPTTAPTTAATSVGLTATNGPTFTPSPTALPTATPLPDVALRDQEDILDRIFNDYVQEIHTTDSEREPLLTRDDFKAGLHDQYLRQVLTKKIEEQLLAASAFQPSSEPTKITTRHILLAVTLPISPTQTQRDAAYAARRSDAEAVLRQLRAGTDFATLAKERSEDLSTKDNGGELPAFDKAGRASDGALFDAAFLETARKLKENEVSDLVQTAFGWDIIQVTKREVDSNDAQLQDARTKAFDAWLAARRTAATIQRFPPVTPTATPLPTATEGVIPTYPLGGEPTVVPTSTLTLTGTTTITTVPVFGTSTVPAQTAESTPTVPLVNETTPPVATFTAPTGTPKP